MSLKTLVLPAFSILVVSMLSQSASGQNHPDSYAALWQKILLLESQGLPQSAMEQVNAVYKKARREKNETQVIKSLLYKNKLAQQFEEDALVKMIDTLQLEFPKSSGTEKALLQSITAQLYDQYFRANRYRLYNVTNTKNFKKDDIRTWSIADFQKKISDLYDESLQDKASKKISLEPFDDIIEKGNTRILRPTLYDLLAHRALQYFKSSENDVLQPAYVFEINDPIAFADAKTFAKAKIQSRDSVSLKLKALHLYQELITMHMKEIRALIDVDIERLQFVYQNAVMPEKDALYLQALKDVCAHYEDPAVAEAGALAGQQMLSSATAANSAQSMIEAVTWLKGVVKKYPNSDGGKEAKNILANVTAPSLSLQSEKVNVPNTPFRTLVRFRNVNAVHLRILKVTKKQEESINELYPMEKRFTKMKGMPVVRQWIQKLPVINDYMEHSVEINTGALPVGEYVIWASTDEQFGFDKNAMAAQFVYISNLSFVQNGIHFFVLNRTTGMPVVHATVTPWRQQYDSKKRRYVLAAEKTLQTDKQGYFSVRENEKFPGSLSLEITSGKDHLFLDDAQNLYTYNYFKKDEGEQYDSQSAFDDEKARFFLFTDRSIYRPGQQAYFKGIGVTKNNETSLSQLLKTSQPITVYLYNANGETVDSAQVKLNEYGSFNGKFTIPQNQLTGQFGLRIDDFAGGNLSFSVEEYKRPKFFVEFDKAKESYRINDIVRITGKVNAYAGNSIDGAAVKYRVTRIPRFLYPWFFWRRPMPQTASMEITNGQMTTDSEGNFTIVFTAVPDKSIDPATEPVFDYKVQADVTDINGETRSEDIVVPVAYKSLDLHIAVGNKSVQFQDSLKTIVLTASNLSGEPQMVRAQFQIFKLKTPERLMRARLWPEPDTTAMTATEFISLFPHDEYRDENQPETWQRLSSVFERQDSVNGLFSFTLDGTLPAGWYVAEASSLDRYGNPVKDVKYFQVINPARGEMAANEYFIATNPGKNYQPGETATTSVGTAAEIYLIQQVEKDPGGTAHDRPSLAFFDLKNTIRTFQFKIDEADRGGFGVMQFFVKDNRFYASKTKIAVPWTNKQLDISFDTYREKTLPGSKESWKVTVKGYEGKKVAAEMLASMYDASLDQFVPHYWQPMNLWPQYASYNNWNGGQSFTILTSFQHFYPTATIEIQEKRYDHLKYLPEYNNYFLRNESRVYEMRSDKLEEVVMTAMGGKMKKNAQPESVIAPGVAPDSSFVSPRGSQINEQGSGIPNMRTNFNETVFFYPELNTDSDGNISFSFTMPDALTKWRMRLQAHTKDLSTGYAEKSIVTQKDLMVMPNAPRFFREGDKLFFSAKVVNMTDHSISGSTEFHLLNATTMNPVDGWFQNSETEKPFTIPARQSTLVTFPIAIPTGFNDVAVYRIVAKAGNMSDGEEAYIPVVTNRMLVTETMTLPMNGTGTKKFSFEKLLKSGNSHTLSNFGLTAEYTPNPAWYAVQALPYLNTYPYECTEQVFNRYFANALAMHIANAAPKVKAIFQQWETADTTALLSNLQKNQELKSLLLEETPWVIQAKSESEQKRNIATLFDIVKMSSQLESALSIVKSRQTENGGFSWFKDGPDNRFITQYILSDLGHLKQLSAWPSKNADDLVTIANGALSYLDARIHEDYVRLKESKVDMSKDHLSAIAVYYLYSRSFFPHNKVSAKAKNAYEYFYAQAKKYWTQQSIYSQGMIALTLYRAGDKSTSQSIVKSLKEKSITSDELGMYWKDWNRGGYWWYEAPIESQSLMIEVFSEVAQDAKAVGKLKTWLLKNKQTNNWETTKATAEAVYALLLQGEDWLTQPNTVKMQLGNKVFESSKEAQQEGTGYFKRKIDGASVTPEMGNITVTVSSPSRSGNESPSWGAVYWQYFEDLDKITFSETPLKLSKKLFVEENSDRGPVLRPVKDGDILKVGDKIKVRIELRVDRDMEYIHMKDMRASCMEPVNVLSGYKWQGALGYYESTRDASTNFFFSELPKGTYVFEYPLFVTHAGNFSNGITSIQCMYAPEFTAHSEGVRITVK